MLRLDELTRSARKPQAREARGVTKARPYECSTRERTAAREDWIELNHHTVNFQQIFKEKLSHMTRRAEVWEERKRERERERARERERERESEKERERERPRKKGRE